MREILFKAKRIGNGEWAEGLLVLLTKISITDLDGELEFEKVLAIQNSSVGSIEIDESTICQYTGLTDKNGNKIWESDIVKKHFYTDYDMFANSEEYIGKVEYIDCAWCIRWKRDDYMVTIPIFMALGESHDAEYFEVIGNIFDNPELLGKE